MASALQSSTVLMTRLQILVPGVPQCQDPPVPGDLDARGPQYQVTPVPSDSSIWGPQCQGTLISGHPSARGWGLQCQRTPEPGSPAVLHPEFLEKEPV